MSEALTFIAAKLEELSLSELAILQEQVTVRLRQRLEQTNLTQTSQVEKRDWPPGFFKNVIGSIPHGQIKVDYEGDFEQRESIEDWEV